MCFTQILYLKHITLYVPEGKFVFIYFIGQNSASWTFRIFDTTSEKGNVVKGVLNNEDEWFVANYILH